MEKNLMGMSVQLDQEYIKNLTKEIKFFRRKICKKYNGLFDILDSDYKFFPESVAKRFLEIIDDEIEARKIMLADLGEE